MSEIRDMFQSHEEALARGMRNAIMPEPARTLVQNRVRRGRRNQALAQVAVVAGVALAVAGGAWRAVALIDHTAEPAASPSSPTGVDPSPSPSPTTSPSPDPLPSPSVTVSTGPGGLSLPGYVTPMEGALWADPLPRGLLETSEPGWVLGVYLPERYSDADGYRDGPGVLYLSAPSVQSRPFQLLEFDPTVAIRLERWSPGETTAIVTVGTRDDRGSKVGLSTFSGLMTLNLKTGEFSNPPAYLPANSHFISTAADGIELWFADRTLYAIDTNHTVRTIGSDLFLDGWHNIDRPSIALDPARTRAVWSDGSSYSVVDVRTGASNTYYLASSEEGCWVYEWLDASTFLATCEGGTGRRYLALPVGASVTAETPVVRTVGSGDAWWGEAVVLANGTIVVGGTTEWASGNPVTHENAYLFNGSSFTALVPAGPFGYADVNEVGGLVYIAADETAATVAPGSLWVYNPVGGAVTQLLPVPPDAGTSWFTGLTSWVVAE